MWILAAFDQLCCETLGKMFVCPTAAQKAATLGGICGVGVQNCSQWVCALQDLLAADGGADVMLIRVEGRVV